MYFGKLGIVICHLQNGKLTVRQGPEKGCACLDVIPYHGPHPYDKEFWDARQDIFASIIAASAVTMAPIPSCTVNTHGKNFQGKPVASPESWCVCNDHGDSKPYSTIPSTSSPCALNTIPTSTILISLISYPIQISVTSCSFVT